MQERKPLKENAQAKKRSKADIMPSEKPALTEKQQRLNSMFIGAAEYGKNAEIARLIKAGADINAKQENDMTALHYAAIQGHTQTCALIIKEYAKAGGDVKELIIAKDNADWVALHGAAVNGYTQTCKLLIREYAKAGGDVKELISAKDKDDEIAMHNAAYNGYTQTCKLLIIEYAKAGGDVKELISAKNKASWTVLRVAASNRYPETVQFFESMENLSEAMGKETFSSFMKSFSECTAT
jgi:ankyrin repeat protein